MRPPTVSIGVPVFNGATTLRSALDSLLAQSFTDLEVVVSDNASTDDTARICREYAESDPRVRYYRNPVNLGARANYNRVFELARGEFFRWNGHDDWIEPTYVQQCIEAFDRRPTAIACYTGLRRVAYSGETLLVQYPKEAAESESQARRFHEALWNLPYHPIFGLFRASALRRTDLIPNVPKPDRTTLVQVALLGTFTHVNEVLYNQRNRNLGRDGWKWLDPANATVPELRVLRMIAALWNSVDRYAEGGLAERTRMKADAVAYVVGKSFPGKLNYYKKVLRHRRGRNCRCPEHAMARVV